MFLLKVLAAVAVVTGTHGSEIKVQKCCERYELMIDKRCAHENETDVELFKPMFSGDDGGRKDGYKFVIGMPECGSKQQWIIYHYPGSQDRLALLPSGELRHYISHHEDPDYEYGIQDSQEEQRHHDYELGSYCVDKIVGMQGNVFEAQFAVVCAPELKSSWNDTDYLLRKVVDPVCHGLAIVCFLTVSLVYFVVPQLRNLVGNILTTLAVCLIVVQAADLVRIFTEFSSHVSFLIADIVMYVSLLAAFFWLNSMGYYIWKTFRSRNVFLRVTDGRKYCYYSCYVWGCTISMAAIAVFAHFMLDTKTPKSLLSQEMKALSSQDIKALSSQDTIGWLGLAVFFTPIAFTILVNIFFYLTTGHVINRMSTYGRIHHKMKYSFEMFVKLFLVMSVSWLFLLLSWLRYDALYYCHMAVNALQAPLILFITVLSQRRVTFLLRQSCCCEQCPCTCCRPGDPTEGADWGEEMLTMATAHY